jgi:hypothetical protein
MDTPQPSSTRPAAEARRELLTLLRQEPRGAANRQGERVRQLCQELERVQPADLAAPGALALLEGVWELRWSSSKQPYLAVGPWLENLQLLAPSQGRAMNLLRLPGALAPLAGIAVEAALTLNPSEAPAGGPFQRVQVRFQRGGWLGPALGNVLDQDLRLCHGNAGTLFALLRRPDLQLADLLLPFTSAPGSESPAGPGPA